MFPCPCCGIPVLEEQPPGTMLTCPVCWWQDDSYQAEHEDSADGANRVSLQQARQNCVDFGISDPLLKQNQRARPGVRFVYACKGTWALACISDGNRGYKMDPTRLSDALGDLLRGLIEVFDSGRASFAWADEPGAWRWVLTRREDRLRIQILRFKAWHHGKSLDPDSQTWTENFQGVEFEMECDFSDFAAEVERVTLAILEHTSKDDYEAQWGHPFPVASIEQLRSYRCL